MLVLEYVIVGRDGLIRFIGEDGGSSAGRCQVDRVYVYECRRYWIVLSPLEFSDPILELRSEGDFSVVREG